MNPACGLLKEKEIKGKKKISVFIGKGKEGERMTLKEILGRVMAALDEVTSFDLTANMEDYRYKIYEGVDATQRELAAICSPIVKTVKKTAENGVLILPEDLYELITIMDLNYEAAAFSYIRPDILRIDDGEYYIMYNAYPTRISELSDENSELEISKDAQEALIYGVCAFLCINDEPDLYRTYMSRYTGYMNSIISRKNERPKATVKGGAAWDL